MKNTRGDWNSVNTVLLQPLSLVPPPLNSSHPRFLCSLRMLSFLTSFLPLSYLGTKHKATGVIRRGCKKQGGRERKHQGRWKPAPAAIGSSQDRQRRSPRAGADHNPDCGISGQGAFIQSSRRGGEYPSSLRSRGSGIPETKARQSKYQWWVIVISGSEGNFWE